MTAMGEPRAVGDPLPPNSEIIEVRVAELDQLFHTIDPTPFRNRDLDPSVEEFIVEWGRESPSTKPLALLVHLDRPASDSDEAAILRDAIHWFFARRAKA